MFKKQFQRVLNESTSPMFDMWLPTLVISEWPALEKITENQRISKSRFQIRESQKKSSFVLEKFREFIMNQAKKSVNFVIAFISYYYDFSNKNLLAPSALAYHKDLLRILVRAVASRILTKAMACCKAPV